MTIKKEVNNMVGQKFGRLTVLDETNHRRKDGHKVYKCKCDCGVISYVASNCLVTGRTKSCGCLNHKRFNVKHGKSDTKLYHVFKCMKERCYKKYNYNYKHYGGRGIKICDEWLNDFMNFYNWAIANGYNDNLTIDRINVNGNYEPSNCRWVDMKHQNNNKRNNVLLTHNGKTKTITQWSDELNISYHILWKRHKRGWSDEECLLGRDV